MSERNIRYILRRLEGAGEVTFERGGGRANTTLYRVLRVARLPLKTAADFRGQSLHGGKAAQEKGATGFRKGGSPLPPNRKEPTTEPSEDLSIKSSAFDTFWRAFPRKVGKRTARAAFDRAIGRALAEQVITGAERYNQDPNREAEFTAHPTTWLNRDGWEDDPLPQSNGQRRYESALDRVARKAMEDLNGRRGQTARLDAPRELPG